MPRHFLHILLAALVVPGLASAVEAGAAPAPAPMPSVAVLTQKRDVAGGATWDGIALPLVSYNSDLGFGFGAVGGIQLYRRGEKLYRHSLGASTFFTTRGMQGHWVTYDAPGLIGPNVRLEARVEYRRDQRAPYYGPGNATFIALDSPAAERFLSYERLSPLALLRFRASPLGTDRPFQLYASYGFRALTVRAPSGTLLGIQQPTGSAGGRVGELTLGALWDTRDEEPNPTRGGLQELAIRGSARPLGSSFDFAGLTAVSRNFFPVGPRVVIAQRATVDALIGEVPFFEWTQTGGLAASEGLGGASSVRGIPRNRFAGQFKILSNTEVRVTAFDFMLFGQAVKVGALAFVDVGRVWQPRVSDGPWYGLHAGAGAGIRVVRRAVVVRLDGALGISMRSQGLYATVGQLF